jgi:hypothetical protein
MWTRRGYESDAVRHYQRAEGLANMLDARVTREGDNASIELISAALDAHGGLAQLIALISTSTGAMPPYECDAWERALGMGTYANERRRAAREAEEAESIIGQVEDPQARIVVTKTNTARPALTLDEDIDNALRGLFDPDIVAEIKAGEAFGALRYRIRQYLDAHPEQTASLVLGYHLDAGTRAFAAVADSPAAFLAKKIGELV